jgi:hypothetical protein
MKTKSHVAAIRAAITDPQLPISPEMMRALLKWDVAAAIAYYLRVNPVVAEEIASHKDPRGEIDKIAEAWHQVESELRSARWRVE